MKNAILEIAIFSFSLEIHTSNFETSLRVLSSLSVQNLERNCLLKCAIWLPMFCTVSMRDLWHSYVGSTTSIPLIT